MQIENISELFSMCIINMSTSPSLIGSTCGYLPFPDTLNNANGDYIVDYTGTAIAKSAGFGYNSNGFYKIPLNSGALSSVNDLQFQFTYVEELVPPQVNVLNLGYSPASKQPLVLGDSRLRIISSNSVPYVANSNLGNELIAFFPESVVTYGKAFYIINGLNTYKSSPSPFGTGNEQVVASTSTSTNGPYYITKGPFSMNYSSYVPYYFLDITTYTKRGDQKFYVVGGAMAPNSTTAITGPSAFETVDINLPTATVNASRFACYVKSSITSTNSLGTVFHSPSSYGPSGSNLISETITGTTNNGVTTYTFTKNTKIYTGTTTAPTQDREALDAAFAATKLEFNILQILLYQGIVMSISEAAGALAVIDNTQSSPGTSPASKTLSTRLAESGPAGISTVGYTTGNSPAQSPAPKAKTAKISQQPGVKAVPIQPSTGTSTTPTLASVEIKAVGVLGYTSEYVYDIKSNYFSYGETRFNCGYFAFIPASILASNQYYIMLTGDLQKYLYLDDDSTSTLKFGLNSALTSGLTSPGSSSTQVDYAGIQGVWGFVNVSGGFNLMYQKKETDAGSTTPPKYLCALFSDTSITKDSTVSGWGGTNDLGKATVFGCFKCSPLNGYCMPDSEASSRSPGVSPGVGSDNTYSAVINLGGLVYIASDLNEIEFYSNQLIKGSDIKRYNSVSNPINIDKIIDSTNFESKLDGTTASTITYDPKYDVLSIASSVYFNKTQAILVPSVLGDTIPNMPILNFVITPTNMSSFDTLKPPEFIFTIASIGDVSLKFDKASQLSVTVKIDTTQYINDENSLDSFDYNISNGSITTNSVKLVNSLKNFGIKFPLKYDAVTKTLIDSSNPPKTSSASTYRPNFSVSKFIQITMPYSTGIISKNSIFTYFDGAKKNNLTPTTFDMAKKSITFNNTKTMEFKGIQSPPISQQNVKIIYDNTEYSYIIRF